MTLYNSERRSFSGDARLIDLLSSSTNLHFAWANAQLAFHPTQFSGLVHDPGWYLPEDTVKSVPSRF